MCLSTRSRSNDSAPVTVSLIDDGSESEAKIAEAQTKAQLCKEIEEEEDPVKLIATFQAPLTHLHATGNTTELPVAHTTSEGDAQRIANLTEQTADSEPANVSRAATLVDDLSIVTHEDEDSTKRVAVTKAPLSKSSHLDFSTNVSVLPATSSMSEEISKQIAELTGITKVTIPVSILELLFKHFDMIQSRYDELKALRSQSLSPSNLPAALAGTDVTDSTGLAMRVSALERIIDSQNVLLNK